MSREKIKEGIIISREKFIVSLIIAFFLPILLGFLTNILLAPIVKITETTTITSTTIETTTISFTTFSTTSLQTSNTTLEVEVNLEFKTFTWNKTLEEQIGSFLKNFDILKIKMNLREVSIWFGNNEVIVRKGTLQIFFDKYRGYVEMIFQGDLELGGCKFNYLKFNY